MHSEVTAISRSTGSIYGGALLTLTGTNWGDIITDNPVQISYVGAVGSTDCWVRETSETEIKCRIDTSKTIEVNKEG